jgi:hypothetical protein
MKFSSAFSFMLAIGGVFARIARPVPPGDSIDEAAAVAASGFVQNATFQQLIDHDNPHLGTFSQFYYYSTEFYKGPGSPVVSNLPRICDSQLTSVGVFHSRRNCCCWLSEVSSSSSNADPF